MIASRETVIHPNKPDITQMLRLARIAANEGDVDSANQLLKRAALLDPANEQVWMMLLYVVETVEDRRTCLMNIIAINPDNESAKSMLAQLEEEAALTDEQRQERRRKPLSARLLDILLWVIEIIVILLLIGLAIVLIAYA